MFFQLHLIIHKLIEPKKKLRWNIWCDFACGPFIELPSKGISIVQHLKLISLALLWRSDPYSLFPTLSYFLAQLSLKKELWLKSLGEE